MSVSSFREFFVELWDYEPMPWQARLADHVAEFGWPDTIGVPTGLGKTACLDIAVWALAKEQSLPPQQRRLPTRIWYVVNRRLLVDQGFERALRIAEQLESATPGSAIGSVAAAFNQGVGGLALQVCRLRGAIDDQSLPALPHVPAIICATVPMFGSRLLFRGYGGSRNSRPIETALASMDALALLDEAHLAEPLRVLAQRIDEADSASGSILPVGRSGVHVASMTATSKHVGVGFDLDDDDRGHPVVAQRLGASKPTELRPSSEKQLAEHLAEAAVESLVDATRQLAVLVFVNTARLAPTVRDRVLKELKSNTVDAEVLMLTGRFRPADSLSKVDDLLAGDGSVASGRDRSALPKHRIIVATQTLEVGADIDVDVLVTQSASVRSLVQRFGRLNRLGQIRDARAVILHPTDQASDPVYGAEPREVWARLESQISDSFDAPDLDLGPAVIASVMGEPADLGPRIPELLPNHLDEYAKTSAVIAGEAPVELFFAGIDDSAGARVQVAWREDVLGSGQVELAPRLDPGEFVELPLVEVRSTLDGKTPRPAWRVASDGLSAESIQPADLRPGDQVVLRSSDGGYSGHSGWDPSTKETTLEVSPVANQILLAPGSVRAALRDADISEGVVDVIAACALLLNEIPAAKLAWMQPDQLEPCGFSSDQESAIEEFVQLVADEDELLGDEVGPGTRRLVPRPVVREFCRLVVTLVNELPYADLWKRGDVRASDQGGWWVLGAAQRRRLTWVRPADDALDELSATDAATKLPEHLASVGETARAIAQALGLPDDLVQAVANAGRLHDLGKIDPRFQAWLGAEDAPLAKSRSGSSGRSDWTERRKAAGWPAGGRHEALSVRIALAAKAEGFTDLLEPDEDLVLHLVASHHGRGRPGMWGVEGDLTGSDFKADLNQLLAVSSVESPVVVSGDLSQPDWDQPNRFALSNRKWGRRGLALLEAVVRQADWWVSAAAEKDMS